MKNKYVGTIIFCLFLLFPFVSASTVTFSDTVFNSTDNSVSVVVSGYEYTSTNIILGTDWVFFEDLQCNKGYLNDYDNQNITTSKNTITEYDCLKKIPTTTADVCTGTSEGLTKITTFLGIIILIFIFGIIISLLKPDLLESIGVNASIDLEDKKLPFTIIMIIIAVIIIVMGLQAIGGMC